MSPNRKCHQKENVTRTKIREKCHPYYVWIRHDTNITKSKCKKNKKANLNKKVNVTKTQKSAKLICYQNPNFTKRKISPKCEFQQKAKSH